MNLCSIKHRWFWMKSEINERTLFLGRKGNRYCRRCGRYEIIINGHWVDIELDHPYYPKMLARLPSGMARRGGEGR